MPKKSIIAVLCAVILVIVVSLTLVFTVGPMVRADSEPVLIPTEYLNIHDGVLGDGSNSGAFTAEGKNFIQNLSAYRVEIPDSVKSIGQHAFWGCDSLTSITIPDGVKSIDDSAIRDCTNLTSITIPSSVESIGVYAFTNCTNLTSITLGKGVESVGSGAFSHCTNLTSITIPSSVKSIESRAFYECSSLTSITIPSSVTRIGDRAFNGCTNLTNIYCEAESQPTGWSGIWKSGCDAEVVWGDKNSEPETAGTDTRKNENSWIVWVIGGAIAALVVAGVIAGVVIVKKRRKH